MKFLIGLCVALSLTANAARAQNAEKGEKGPPILATQDRTVEHGRAVQVVLPQTQIGTALELGRVAAAGYSDGLLGALVMNDFNRDVRDKQLGDLDDRAQALAAPVRAALADFDVDSLALATTRAAVAKPDWLQAGDVRVSKEMAPNSPELLASSDATQFLFIRYRYELSPDFTQVRVIADLILRRRTVGRAQQQDPIYHQRIASVVQLRVRSYEPRENVAQWSADHGKLARAALTTAFAQFETLIPRALGMQQSDLTALNAKQHDKAFAAGFYGPLIERNPNDAENVLIWSNGLIHVQPAG